MTDSPPLFEEMLAAYPADKREFARRVYDRFANGDATEFFAQLFLLLDVYANYAKRIPQAVSETNQSTLASLKKVREEIGLLAQTVESRSVNWKSVRGNEHALSGHPGEMRKRRRNGWPS